MTTILFVQRFVAHKRVMSSIFGKITEELPDHVVLSKKDGEYEVRKYAPCFVASVRSIVE